MSTRKPPPGEKPEEPIDFTVNRVSGREPKVDFEAFKVEIEGISARAEADTSFDHQLPSDFADSKIVDLEIADLDDPDDFDIE